MKTQPEIFTAEFLRSRAYMGDHIYIGKSKKTYRQLLLNYPAGKQFDVVSYDASTIPYTIKVTNHN